jgi:hypothetical protein
MQRRLLVKQSPNSSFKPRTLLIERDYPSYTGDNVNLDTNLLYANLFANKDDEDRVYLSSNNDYPPKYYI